MYQVVVPSLCEHKSKGLLYVRQSGPERTVVYLGRKDDPGTIIRYRRFTAEFIANNG